MNRGRHRVDVGDEHASIHPEISERAFEGLDEGNASRRRRDENVRRRHGTNSDRTDRANEGRPSHESTRQPCTTSCFFVERQAVAWTKRHEVLGADNLTGFERPGGVQRAPAGRQVRRLIGQTLLPAMAERRLRQGGGGHHVASHSAGSIRRGRRPRLPAGSDDARKSRRRARRPPAPRTYRRLIGQACDRSERSSERGNGAEVLAAAGHGVRGHTVQERDVAAPQDARCRPRARFVKAGHAGRHQQRSARAGAPLDQGVPRDVSARNLVGVHPNPLEHLHRAQREGRGEKREPPFARALGHKVMCCSSS